MPFIVAEGLPGSGKSLWTAEQTLDLLRRNKRWHEVKARPLRKVWCNLKLSAWAEEHYGEYIQYWGDASGWKYDLEWIAKNLIDADLVWDEISAELDASGYKNTGRSVKRFLAQWRKRGVDIYANTQDYADVDINARRRVTNVMTFTKIFGSRDISATKPPPKWIFGLCVGMDVENPKELDITKKQYDYIPGAIVFISRELVELYDTTALIGASDFAPLKHIRRDCPECGKRHITHE